MNILSKQFLIETIPRTVAYEAYYVNNGVVTLLGDVTDLSKTFASQDEFVYSNLFVYEGDLYSSGSKVTTGRNVVSITGRTISSSYYSYYIYDSGSMVSLMSDLTETAVTGNWNKACGYTGASNNYSAFAEASDGLYELKGGTKISTLTGWTKITGYGSTSSSSYYGYGINDGKLYYLYANGDGVVQKGSDTTWSDITGSRESTSWNGYGINNGKLYKLSGTPSQVGSDTTWTKVTGTTNGSSAYALGLNGGKLYRIKGTTATQVGSSADWQGCSGYCMSGGIYGLAYDSTALYGISDSGTTTKLMDGEWVYCGGNYSGSSAYGVMVRKG